MESIKRFNGLNGATVSREELLQLLDLAEKEEQFHISQKLKTILLKNSDSNFSFDIETPAFESTPKSMLNGLQMLEESEDVFGLGKAVSSNDVYDMITNLVVNTIKKVGHLPWQKEWQGSGGKQARNYVTKKPYSGINFMLLNFDVLFDENDEPYLVPVEFENPYYLTFNQIKEAKATLKKGSKARNVIYYTPLFVYDDGNKKVKTSDKGKYSAFIQENGINETDLKFYASQIPIVKYYNVFKADDCTGLKFPTVKEKEITPIESAQAIIDNYPNPPKYTFIGTDAKYLPISDEVNMPSIKAFTKESFYYSTYFHELIHSTGHSKRLDRGNDTRKRDGSIEDKKAYAFEELVAELGAVFLCSESGILFHTLENSAKYLNGWNKRLLSYLQEDNKMFFKASAQAQKASNWILDLDADDVPAYLRNKLTPKSNGQEKAKIIAKKPISKKEKPTKSAVKPKSNGQEKTRTRSNYSRKRKYVSKPKVGKNGQTALFGAKKGLRSPFAESAVKTEPTVIEEIIPDPLKTETTVLAKVENFPPKKYKTAIDRLEENNAPKQLYDIKGDLAKFLGKIEIKPQQSLVITLDSGEGGGKTHTLYNWANEFFEAGYKTIIWSLEEHATSGLATDKAEQYFGANKAYIPVESENDNESKEVTVKRLFESINDFDVIMIDSWAKVMELDKMINIDQDLRKKFNGKLIVVVLQRTVSGEIRGGSKAGFDGDIILKVEVDRNDFRNNYIYNHKNRYNDYMPISDLKYSPYYRKLLKTESEKATEVPKLSFTAIEI